MSNMIKINNKVVVEKFWDNKKVITLKEIDEVYGLGQGTSSSVMYSNKKHFEDNKDVYRVTSKEYKSIHASSSYNYPRGCVLLTQSGYNKIKQLIERRLKIQINDYFNELYFNDVVEYISSTEVVEKKKGKCEIVKENKVIASSNFVDTDMKRKINISIEYENDPIVNVLQTLVNQQKDFQDMVVKMLESLSTNKKEKQVDIKSDKKNTDKTDVVSVKNVKTYSKETDVPYFNNVFNEQKDFAPVYLDVNVITEEFWEKNKEQNGYPKMNDEDYSAYTNYKNKIFEVCTLIMMFGNYKTVKDVKEYALHELDKQYGVCLHQIIIDYKRTYHRPVVNKTEAIYHYERTHSVYRNLFYGKLITILSKEQERSKGKLTFPVTNNREMDLMSLYLIKVTKNKSLQGCSFYNSFYAYASKKLEINWQALEKKYREEKNLGSNFTIKKKDLLYRFDEVEKTIVPVFNNFVIDKFTEVISNNKM